MLNETFYFIVELYFGYHICIDPIRASLNLLAFFICYLCPLAVLTGHLF